MKKLHQYFIGERKKDKQSFIKTNNNDVRRRREDNTINNIVLV
jgi:hypothetical protein